MSVFCELMGNVLVSHWDGVISAEDPQQVFTETRSAYERLREPLVTFAILSRNVKRPTLEAGKFMYANHMMMQEMHRSIHIVVLAKGLVASSLKTFVTLGLMDGTGGKLSVHDGMKEAWAEAEKYGRLYVPYDSLMARLRVRDISLA